MAKMMTTMTMTMMKIIKSLLQRLIPLGRDYEAELRALDEQIRPLVHEKMRYVNKWGKNKGRTAARHQVIDKEVRELTRQKLEIIKEMRT